MALAALGADAAIQAQGGKKDLERAEALLRTGDFAGTDAALSSAETKFSRARSEIIPYKILLPVPWIGRQVSATDDLLTSGIEATRAIRSAVGVLSEVLKVAGGDLGQLLPESGTFASLTPVQKREILAKLLSVGPSLREVREAILRSREAFDRIPKTGLAAPLRLAIIPFGERLDILEGTLAPLAPLAEVLPRVAGYPVPRTHLFLLQNYTEIRPSGGFIGSFGIVKVADGDLVSFDTHDVYSLDNPATGRVAVKPPAPLAKYLGVKTWFFRDSNWSPDFRQAAEEAIRAYDREVAAARLNFPPVDSVIGMTPRVAEDLLRLVGPITVSGVTFTPENLVDELEYQVELGFLETGLPPAQRKEIQGELAGELLRRLTSLPVDRWPEILRILGDGLREKRIMIYDRDPSVQERYQAFDWAGRVKETSGDFLMVVDANLASLKTDAVVDRTIGYRIYPDESGALHGVATITYKNNGSFTWKTTRYRTYTRIYAPAGSRFLRGEGAMENDKILDPRRRPGTYDAEEELGKAVFGAFVSVEPGETRSLTFEYLLPDSIGDGVSGGRYTLLAEKQPGTSGHRLTLDLDFGKRVVRAAPPEDPREFGDARYRFVTDLRIDRQFVVGF